MPGGPTPGPGVPAILSVPGAPSHEVPGCVTPLRLAPARSDPLQLTSSVASLDAPMRLPSDSSRSLRPKTAAARRGPPSGDAPWG